MCVPRKWTAISELSEGWDRCFVREVWDSFVVREVTFRFIF